MTGYTENKTDSSSSDSSGEKMLTEQPTDLESVCAALRGQLEFKLRDRPATPRKWYIETTAAKLLEELSATIKRLETPVADEDVRFVLNELGNHARSARERGASELANFLERALPIVRRQAREIERRQRQYEQVRAAMTKALSWLPTDSEAAEVIRAALSLNSVETREMKP